MVLRLEEGVACVLHASASAHAHIKVQPVGQIKHHQHIHLALLSLPTATHPPTYPPLHADLVYPEPFVGRQEIDTFMRKIAKSVPKEIKFCVEDATDGDPRKVGVRW